MISFAMFRYTDLNFLISVFSTEQEEEMNAEGGDSIAEESQSDTTQDRDFLCGDDGKDEEPLGPKFKSLRHLRQVDWSQNPLVLFDLNSVAILQIYFYLN